MDEEILTPSEEEITPSEEETIPSNEETVSTEEETPVDEVSTEEENVPAEGESEEDYVEPPYYAGYKILDNEGREITDPDLTLGYLVKDHLTINHPAIPAKYHYKVRHVTLTDGTDFYPEDNDPRINMPDNQVPNWSYVAPEPESIIEQYVDEDGQIQDRVVTVPAPTVKNASVAYIVDTPAIEAYDEIETIYRYILYTEKELANNTFLAEGPGRLDGAEESINDITEVVAGLAGSDIEERVDNASTSIDELTEVVAELAGSDIEDRVNSTEERLTTNEETLDELLLVVADILGGATEEEESV